MPRPMKVMAASMMSGHGRGVGDVEQGNGHRRCDFGSEFVHGVGAQNDEVGAACLELPRGRRHFLA